MKPEIGTRYGKWIIKEISNPRPYTWEGRTWMLDYVIAVCDCGFEKEVKFDNMKKGISKSCGHCCRMGDLHWKRKNKNTNNDVQAE